MTLNDLLIDCCTRLNYPPDLTLVEARVQSRLKAFLNQTQTEILGQPSYRRLLHAQIPLVTVDGQADYGLPDFVSRIVAITDPTRQIRLGMMSVDAYREALPNPDTQRGNPVRYAFDGWSSTMRQPRTTPCQVYAYSISDNAPTQMRITTTERTSPGLFPPGSYASTTASVVLNSAIPFPGILMASAALFHVWDVELTQPSINTVFLVEPDPALTPIAQILIGKTRSRSAQIYLAPTPSGPVTLQVFYEREAKPLTSALDEPILPPRFHYLLAAGARMKEYELRGDTTRYGVAKREFDSGLAFLNAWVSDQPDANDQMTPNDRRYGGSSVLGPWFPSTPYR